MTANESTGESTPHDIRSTASETTTSEPEYTQVTDAPDIVATVADHLVDVVDETTYLKARDIDSRVGLTTQQTGTALGWLAKVDDAPVDIERWSQTRNGVTWRIEPAEPQLVTDGRRGISPATVEDVVAHLEDIVDGREYVKAASIAADLDHSPRAVGHALAKLSNRADAPVTVEKWSETRNTVTWVVEPRDDGGQTVVADGGPTARTCPECSRTHDRHDLVATPEGVRTCPDCGAAVEPYADGGQQFHVVDERRRTIIAGPFADRVEAQRDDAAQEPNTIIVSDRALALAEAEGPIRDERGDVDIVTDGGTVDGAIDNDFDDAERAARDQLLERLAGVGAPTHAAIEAGDVVIDLVTRQPVLVQERVADDLAEYYEREDFDLLTYKQHAFLPVTIDDAVFRCVFVGGVDDLHSFSNTYDYPAGRLARVPVELAGGDDT